MNEWISGRQVVQCTDLRASDVSRRYVKPTMEAEFNNFARTTGDNITKLSLQPSICNTDHRGDCKWGRVNKEIA
jgi:hypothetical protein